MDVQAGGDGDVHGGEEQGLLLHQDRAGGRLQLRVQLGGDLSADDQQDLMVAGGWKALQEVHREPEQDHEDVDSPGGRHHVPSSS